MHSSRYSDSSPVPYLWATLHLLCKLQVTDGSANLVSPGGHLIDLLNTRRIGFDTCLHTELDPASFPKLSNLTTFSMFSVCMNIWPQPSKWMFPVFLFSAWLNITKAKTWTARSLGWISGSPDHLPRFWRDPMHWSLMTCYRSGRTHHCRRPFMNWISQDRWAKACVTHILHGGNQDCQHRHQEHWHLVREC